MNYNSNNKYIITKEIKKINKVDWSNFVISHPYGNIFQSPVIFDFYKVLPGFSPIIYICLNSDNKIQGILLAIIQSESGLLKKYMSRRTIVYGGPLVRDNNVIISDLLIKSLVKDTKIKSIYTEFRNLFDLSFVHSAFINNRFDYREHLNFLIPLLSEEENKKILSKSKLRQIKSTIKAGVFIKNADNESQVLNFYLILKELYRTKVKKPLPTKDFFIEFFRRPELGTILIVEKEGSILGGMICPVFQDKTIYEWFVCGLDGIEKDVYPSVLVTWAAIEYGIKSALKSFDFMGAGSPDAEYGVREFKSKFGGNEVSYGRYLLINNPFLYHVGKLGLRILGSIKKL